jgi:hypothetical protein
VLIPRLQRAPRDDINPDAQKLFKILEQADVIKERRACLEVHKQIQIAVGASLAPGDRAEHCDSMCSALPRDTEDLHATAAQAVQGQYYVVHPPRVPPAPRRGLGSVMPSATDSRLAWHIVPRRGLTLAGNPSKSMSSAQVGDQISGRSWVRTSDPSLVGGQAPAL